MYLAYDLRTESWVPFRRAKGEIVWGSPGLLTDGVETGNPIVALAAPRPDFNGALLEFLIGLFSAALKAEDEDAWQELWDHPPPPEVLREALASLPDAFDLDGEGPRFLQDFTPSDFNDDKTINEIEALLIDAAGGKTARLNKDLFVKRDRVSAMGRPAAAMALIALQTYAPSGGQGHRTSMRGGGPLTTLIEPRVNQEGETDAQNQPLWRKIWANAETVEQWRERGPDTADAGAECIFPWLARTRTSNPKEQGRPTTPQDGHPLQVYFGIPRRIRIDFKPGSKVCDLTGRPDDIQAKEYRARNYGVEYPTFAWAHPLTPYYKDKDGQFLPIHGQRSGIGWRDWAALVAFDESKRRAQAVVQFLERRASRTKVWRPRLHAFGYDMGNMKARGWVEAELPAYALDKVQIGVVSRAAANLTEAANIAASVLLFAVKSAWFQRPEDAKGDLSIVKTRFWVHTETAFFAAIQEIIDSAGQEDIDLQVCQGFLKPLSDAATGLFNEMCPMGGLEFADARRLVSARYGLNGALRGYGKLGGKLFDALGLSRPEKKTKAPKASAERKEPAA